MTSPVSLHEVRPQVSDAEYARLLGYPAGKQPDGRVLAVAGEARRWYAQHGRPWVRIREVQIARIGAFQVDLDGGIVFDSPVLAERLQAVGAHAVVAAAVSAGPEAEHQVQQLWQQDRPDEAFALDAFASAVVEQSLATLGAELCGSAEPRGMAVLPHYSPGYNGWPLADQHSLYRLLAPEFGPGGVPILEALPSGMLRPRKSILAVFGLTRDIARFAAFSQFVPCAGCSFSPCAYRRVPFAGPQGAAVHRETEAAPTRGPVYAFPEKALQRWSTQWLKLETERPGFVSARFHYSGQTCSNMGAPLALIYTVRLARDNGGWRIAACSCDPLGQGSSFEATCEYIRRGRALLDDIDAEHPLAGRTLEQALEWEPDTAPSGCLCTAANRNHKWRIVFHTIHYGMRKHGLA